ncbi:MAG: hypothetical protein JWM74_2343 [Myxococcaceae bacterium]|nr:hypothetical protein [Myxococcaceae bacterium]
MVNLRLVASASASVALLIVACSSAEDPNAPGEDLDAGTSSDGSGDAVRADSSGDTSSSVDSGAVDGGACPFQEGNYNLHYVSATTTTGPASSCQKAADKVVPLSAPSNDAGAGVPLDGGDSGQGCNYLVEVATCTNTADCTIPDATETLHLKTILKNNLNGVISGTQIAKRMKNSDGSLVFDCTYEFTYTKI